MPEPGGFFQRYQSPDPAALAQRVEEDCALLEQARAAQDTHAQLELLSRIGANYTILGKEAQAAPLLEQALAFARDLADQQLEVRNLINLATAQQYLGQRDSAERLFQEAITKAQAASPQYEHLAWHHLGRCLVEQGKLEEARACFEQALILRKRKGDQSFINSTQRALDAVQAML